MLFMFQCNLQEIFVATSIFAELCCIFARGDYFATCQPHITFRLIVVQMPAGSRRALFVEPARRAHHFNLQAARNAPQSGHSQFITAGWTMRAIDDIDFSELSSNDRLQLAQALLDSVLYDARAEPFSDEQMRELDDRLAQIDSGTVQGEPWDQVRDQLLNKR